MEKAHCLDSEESRWWALKSCSKFSTLFVLDAWWSWNTPRSVGSFTHTVIGLSATPPSLWPGRELRKYHHYVRGNEYSVFKVRLTVSGFPLIWGVALAVTIVYLKAECFFRMSCFRFLLLKNRKHPFRF